MRDSWNDGLWWELEWLMMVCCGNFFSRGYVVA